jgi:hypothetical protein
MLDTFLPHKEQPVFAFKTRSLRPMYMSVAVYCGKMNN